MMKKMIKETTSLCPVCMEKVDALIYTLKDEARMEKECPQHGWFDTLLWKGEIPYTQWLGKKKPATIEKPLTEIDKGCPFDCGLCSGHQQHTCTALIEITQNCNLACRFCFADAKGSEQMDPTLEQINLWYKKVMEVSGNCNIQLSGGEPTLRDDLPQIVKMGRQLGFGFVQVNTNGIRLAEDRHYVKSLKEAGLSSVYLQFDGTKDDIYKKLRGRELLNSKKKAIEHCKEYEIGVVLVPTLVPGININNIGEMVDFALEHTPIVKGIHFQPVSYFGRMPCEPKDKDRITLPEIMKAIEDQTKGKISIESFKPPGCENSLCSFHGSYLYDENKKLIPITKKTSCCTGETDATQGAVKAKAYVAKNWSIQDSNKSDEKKSDWDEILDKIQNNTFSVSAMAFQDIWNVDLQRVKDCCIHVVHPEGKLVPFCIYNITSTTGKLLYRGC